MGWLQFAKYYEEYIIAMRREFHTWPELSGKEEETVRRVCRELTAMDIPFVVVENGGVIGCITGCKDNGRAVLLRADMDALPVSETADNLLPGARTCVSQNEGIMHACGHDGHMAMLLGAAKVLKDMQQELCGKVYLCFERGEEGGGNVRYLMAYLEKNDVHIDAVYGAHLVASLPAGRFAVNDGAMMAGMMWFGITLHGKGGHGSRPDEANSPIDCFAAIYQRLQALRVSKISPFGSCSYSIGSLHSGAKGNVIPETLTFYGTMRTFDRDGAGMLFYNELRNTVDGICAVYGCTPEYELYELPSYGVVNDEAYAVWTRQLLANEFGADCVGSCEPWMASESYSDYLMQWPGVFAFLGIDNPEKGCGAAHHNPAFDIDEAVLVKGATAAAAFAAEFLQNCALHTGRKLSYKELLKRKGRQEQIEQLFS